MTTTAVPDLQTEPVSLLPVASPDDVALSKFLMAELLPLNVPTLKEITSQTDSCLVSLASKTYVSLEITSQTD